PSELVHFGLLGADGSRGGQTVSRLTPFGEAFLRGTAALAERVWAEGAELPREGVPGSARDKGELTAEVTAAARGNQDAARARTLGNVSPVFRVRSKCRIRGSHRV